MILRLACKNMKKSMSDDVVYFVTLILGICMYYMFDAVSEQPVIREKLEDELSHHLVRYVWYLLPAVRIIVLVVFAGLIVYANRFLMKRRKKEFGMYLLLGMNKRTIAGILFVETMIVGSVSLVFGVVLGIVLSQGVSMLMVNLFVVDLSEFTFVVSGKAVTDTILCFLVIYALVYVLNLIATGRLRLIRLFQAGKRSEKVGGKPVLCTVVFVIAAAMLGRVYYMVTVRRGELNSPEPIYIQIGILFVATILIFWSLSGLLLFFARFRKSFYLRGIHAFTVREISSRVGTNILAGSLICFLMFIAMSMVNSCFALSHTLSNGQKSLLPVDVLFEMDCAESRGLPFDADTMSIGEMFQRQGIDTGMFRDVTEITLYNYYKWNEKEQIEYSDNSMLFIGTEVMKLSDYNRLAKAYGNRQYTLSDNEYFVVSNREWQKQWCSRYYLSKNHVITFGGVNYYPKYKECQDGFLRLEYIPDNFGFTVVPDQVAPDSNLHPESVYYIANYNAATAEEAKRIDDYVQSDAFLNAVHARGFLGERSFQGTYKSEIHQRSVVVITMVIYLGLYIGILFVMTSAALFSLKELTQAVESRGKYKTLWCLGVDKRMLRRSLFIQNAIFFGVPMVLAILHSVFGSMALTELLSSIVEFEIGEISMMKSFWRMMGVLLGVYLVYFMITVRGSRKIMKERVD